MSHKRNAVVIGGAQGIGFAVSELLAKDCDSLVIADLNKEAVERAAKKLSGRIAAMPMQVDITNKDQVAAMREKVTKEFGAPTILINSAAIVDDKLFLEST